MKNKFKAQFIESNEVTLKGKEIACNIINDDMTKPPKWFQHWSETVYQKHPPQWFQHWSETRFEPLVNDVKDLKSRMLKVETRLDNIEAKVNTIIKLNNLRVE